MRSPVQRVAALACFVAVIAACGGSSGPDSAYKEPTGPAVATLKINAGNVYFKPTELTAPPGIVQIKLYNQESGTHDLVIKDISGFHLEVSGEGSNASGKVDLKAKKYEFSCTIPGHKEAGMKGTITVS